MLSRLLLFILLTAHITCVGCSDRLRSEAVPHGGSQAASASDRRPHLVATTCADADCSNCDPALAVCQYCDSSSCPPFIVVGGPTLVGDSGGGIGSTPRTGPLCAQTVSGPDGSFDGIRTNVRYVVPSYAQTQWTMLSQRHVDQVNVDFYVQSVYAGTNAQGGTSISQVGSYTSSPPTKRAVRRHSYDGLLVGPRCISHDAGGGAHVHRDCVVVLLRGSV